MHQKTIGCSESDACLNNELDDDESEHTVVSAKENRNDAVHV
jgi:hypothetical protein